MEEKIISESLTKDFRHHLAREERSDSTIEKYVKEILRFAQWMKGLPVTKEEVSRWKEHQKRKICSGDRKREIGRPQFIL